MKTGDSGRLACRDCETGSRLRSRSPLTAIHKALNGQNNLLQSARFDMDMDFECTCSSKEGT